MLTKTALLSEDDLELMLILHDAFRRDVAQLARSAARRGAADPAAHEALLTGWRGFSRELQHHHQIEDTYIWPLMRAKLGDHPDDVAVLDAMEAEHELIDPALAAVEAGLTDTAHEHRDLAAHVDNLASILHSHLAHEERDALPLVKVTVTAKEWHALSKDAMKKMNYRWVTEMVPWLVDGLPPERSRVALANIPAPLRLLNRYSWEPRHRRTRRWE